MSEQELPRLSKDAISQSIQTKSDRSVLLMKVPNLNLFVITDCNNFGSNWIEVSFSNKVYTTRYLMGENEDLFSVIARRFAQDIIGKLAILRRSHCNHCKALQTIATELQLAVLVSFLLFKQLTRASAHSREQQATAEKRPGSAGGRGGRERVSGSGTAYGHAEHRA